MNDEYDDAQIDIGWKGDASFVSTSALWSVFLRCDAEEYLDREIKYLNDVDTWNDYGFYIKLLPQIIKFCENKSIRGIPMLAVILCCLRARQFGIDAVELVPRKLGKQLYEVDATSILSKCNTIIHHPYVTGEMDNCWEGYNRGNYLGRGFYGVVHMAKRKSDSSYVAMKQITVHQSDTKSLVRREIELLGKCQSPFTLQLFTHFERIVDSYPTVYIITELCEMSLADLLKQKGTVRFTEQETWDLCIGIAAGLYAAHSNDAIHRDLHPGNFLIKRSTDGRLLVKLADFGLAKQASTASETQSNANGVVSYKCPDKLSGKFPIRFGKRSDVWSLGCIWYEICTLQKAFPNGYSDNAFQNLVMIDTEVSWREDISQATMSCLQVKSTDRPSVIALLRSLPKDQVQSLLTAFAYCKLLEKLQEQPNGDDDDFT